jgi:hypothetical protein
VLAFPALLFAIVPRALTASWIVLGYGLIVGVFGPAMAAACVTAYSLIVVWRRDIDV